MPRRRLPLRPRLGARARALRRRPPLGVLRRDPPGSGALAGQADRRALGRRARRLPGRELPGALVRVERHVPRHDARLLARARRRRGVRARFTGSSDLYEDDGRHPSASINFVTAHDGFTLRDLVSYDEKHNEANGEGNRDGTDDNRSWNCGVEGPTDDPEVNALRERQQRNFLATLLLSQGVPMLLAGDEIAQHAARQQQRLLPGQRALVARLGARRARGRALAFTRRLLRLRGRASGVPARRVPDRGGAPGSGVPDAWWFRPDGRKMTAADWARGDACALGVFLNGGEIPTLTRGRRADRRRVVPRALQRLARARHVRAAAAPLRPPLGASSCAPPSRRSCRTARPTGARGSVPLEARALRVLRRVG